MSKIIKPGQKNKPLFLQRLDYLQGIMAGFERSLIQKDIIHDWQNFYAIFLIERIVEAIADPTLVKTPQEFFTTQAEAAKVKYDEIMERAKKKADEAKEDKK